MKKLMYIFFALPILTGCKEKKSAGAMGGMPTPEISVTKPIIKNVTLTKDYPGYLTTEKTVNLVARVNGTLQSTSYTPGGRVKQGQLLFVIEPTLYKDKVEQAEAALKTAQAQLEYARSNYSRMKEAVKSDAVSQIQVLQAESSVAEGVAAVNNAEAALSTAHTNLSYCYVRAPFDGIIGLRQISVGSYASPTTIVAKLTKITPLKVEFSVPERYASQIKKGTNLNFRIEGKLDAFSAKVYAVESTIDPNLHQYTARALYPNTNRALLPGRYTSIQLKKEEIPNAIAIPTEAIVPEMGKDKVFLYKSGKAEPVEVTTGIRTDAEVQIVRGLQVGDTILTSGTLQLRLGLPVTLDNID